MSRPATRRRTPVVKDINLDDRARRDPRGRRRIRFRQELAGARRRRAAAALERRRAARRRNASRPRSRSARATCCAGCRWCIRCPTSRSTRARRLARSSAGRSPSSSTARAARDQGARRRAVAAGRPARGFRQRRRPGQLSGGQKQRVCIARALAAEPDLIICDEPTSALDPLVAEEVLKLLRRLQDELGLAYMFITHDLGTVRRIAHRTAVMLKGEIIAQGPDGAISSRRRSIPTPKSSSPRCRRWTRPGSTGARRRGGAYALGARTRRPHRLAKASPRACSGCRDDGRRGHRTSLHPARRRRPPRGAALAAGRCGGEARAGDPRIHPLSQARRHARRATSRCTAGSPRMAMRRSASTCAVRANPTAHMADEYLRRELEDACEVIDWLSRQSWCNGRVGMMGKSWGGFNALQTAALRPPALKAIITVCSTDDRYADDIHYMGGALLNDNLWWGTIMLAYQARPPDPALVGEAWRDAMARAARSACRSFPRSGSPISAATPIGGTARSARIFPPSPARSSPSAAGRTPIPTPCRACSRGSTSPRLGLIGPWAHIYPQDGAPGPAIGFLQEALRWWDHWLKGEDRGIMAEPMLRAFIEEWSPPGDRDPAPGRFVGEARLAVAAHRAARAASRTATASARRRARRTRRRSARPAGPALPWANGWAPASPGEAPADQRHDDGFSLRLRQRAARRAHGNSRRAGDRDRDRLRQARRAALRAALRRRAGRLVAPRFPTACSTSPIATAMPSRARSTPGAFYPDPPASSTIAATPSRRAIVIRLALSTAYWPLIWPAPEAATLDAAPARQARLPVRPPDPRDERDQLRAAAARPPQRRSTRLARGPHDADRRARSR